MCIRVCVKRERLELIITFIIFLASVCKRAPHLMQVLIDTRGSSGSTALNYAILRVRAFVNTLSFALEFHPLSLARVSHSTTKSAFEHIFRKSCNKVTKYGGER